MYLKSIEAVGFKSFADPTVLEFDRGVTAVVGPNGCGKSNVLDAIRWVLGEQSAKALRGGSMQDVIFSGSDSRKPLGMAEVSLNFAECEDALGTEYHEVRISAVFSGTDMASMKSTKRPAACVTSTASSWIPVSDVPPIPSWSRDVLTRS